MLALLLGAAAATAVNACADLPGPPLNASRGSSCAAYAGACDANVLSTAEKAKLMLHCPHTCRGTQYGDGGGHAYCACVPGHHDCCFDEPNDCSTRPYTTVVSQAMCRKSLGLCTPAVPAVPASSHRQASACGEEIDDVSARMGQYVASQRETLRLAREVGAGAGSAPNPRLVRLAMSAFQ